MADKGTDMIMVYHEEIVSIDAKPDPCIASVSDTKRQNQISEESYSIDDKPQPCVADDKDCQKEVSGYAIMELTMPETVKEAVMDDDIKINDLTDEIVQINPPEFGANDDKSIHDYEEIKEVAHNEDHMDVSSFSKKEDFQGKEESKIEKHVEDEFVDQKFLQAEQEALLAQRAAEHELQKQFQSYKEKMDYRFPEQEE